MFANLVDFDQQYGHRNDPAGFARALEAFDERLAEILAHLRSDELCLITADHGNDPTTPSTDHSREYVPLLVGGPRVRGGAGSRHAAHVRRRQGHDRRAVRPQRRFRTGATFLREIRV